MMRRSVSLSAWAIAVFATTVFVATYLLAHELSYWVVVATGGFSFGWLPW